MIVHYNSLNRLESPKFTLCSPGSVYNDGYLTNVVGILTDHEAEEIVFNFNATSELNFRINKIQRDDAEENEHIYRLYKSVQNRRLIFIDNIGYFMITNIKDGAEENVRYKDVSAQSIDIEIAQKMIPYIANNTYRFLTNNDETSKGLLNIITETLPAWTIGYVDDIVSQKWRTFEDVDTSLNCLGFLLDNMQDAYECIFIFDIINRTINVYDQSNYIRQTGIHITKDDVISSINITENADDLYTAINVLGDSNITISAINPLGTNVIYNFDYYLDWMSDGLKTKVSAWQNAVQDSFESYYNTNLQYYKKLTEASNLQLELEKLTIQLTMYNRCRDNIVAESSTDIVGSYNTVIINNGGVAIEVYEEIADTISEIDNLINICESNQISTNASLDSINLSLSSLKTEIEEIHNSLSITNYFTKEEYDELCNYIYEGSYTDEYVTVTDIMSYEDKFSQMKILYDRAKNRLERVSQPTREFDIDVESFIFTKDFEHLSEQLETGCLINVELDTNDIALLFLSNITINYDDHSLSMTFGNRFNKFDPKSLFDDVLGDISKSANTLNYLKEILYPIKNGEFNEMKEALQTSRDLTMNSALSSDTEEVIIDGSGYTGKKLLVNGTFDPRQIKITGKTIVFTDDAWETCKAAIGELIFGDGSSAYGINAESIVGDIIMGNNLRIIDSNGNDLLTVVDGKITSQVADVNSSITRLEQLANNISIRVTTLENDDNEIDHVRTTTGYTFDADGLNIYKSGEEIRNLLDNTGMYVSRSDEEILSANNEGVNAINLTAKQYLTIGINSRFEDYSNGSDTKRTACFYIGL